MEENNKKQDKSEVKEKTVAELTEELNKIQAERDEYLAGWQRAKADFINARKRADEDLKEYRKFAQEGLVVELISVLESFEMAFNNKEAWEKADKNWRAGIEYIHSQLKSILEANGLKEINPLGQKFDPQRDEASKYEPTEVEADDHKITKVIQKGYELNGKSVRPPKVIVAEFKK